jgi:3-hydroxyisobutyrate dehydrogenase-like beta-hydroxyacid dehydrogenase
VPPARRRPALRITAVTKKQAVLTVLGRREAGATGRVTITFTSRISGRARAISRKVTVSRGRFAARLTLRGALRSARTGTATVHYGGDARWLPTSHQRRVSLR